MRTIIIQKCCAAVAGFLALLGAAGAPAAEYLVSISDDLAQMHVTGRFEVAVRHVAARSRDAGTFLVSARDCERDTPLGNRGRRLLLPDAGVRCIRYTVDLDAAARLESRNRRLAPGARIVAPAAWLWLTVDAGEPRVRFEMPDGVRVSVPWQREPDGAYRVADSPRSGTAPAVFGRFDLLERELPGGRLRIALPRGPVPFDAPAVADGIASAAATVAGVYGRLPNPAPQVVVLPVAAGHGSDAIPFGRVIRDGGETVELLLDETAPANRVAGDWTVVHEFVHLLHPRVERDDRWVTEGLAQYLQNVLLARAGVYSETQAWQNLLAGLERGRRSMPQASPAAATASGESSARMKIYWSGAALALLADVELRRRSGGGESLDSALASLANCCLPSPAAWSAREFLAALDAAVEHPVFGELYARYADQRGFPDTADLEASLGIRYADDRVTFDDNAPLAALRRALTAGPGPAANGGRSILGSPEDER